MSCPICFRPAPHCTCPATLEAHVLPASPEGLRNIRVGIAVFIKNSKAEYLLGLRKDTDEWGVPGGHLETGETLEEGIAREAREETGLEVSNIQKLTFYKGYRPDKEFDYVTLYFTAETDSMLFTINDEHHLLKWCNIWNLPQPLFASMEEAVPFLQKELNKPGGR